ncbi:hypothetical protein FRC12_013852 [Ceratobasidium sp. 428]|nr:hypothetical protein FRC12_013852 [Ceratobasidium sp. 428]
MDCKEALAKKDLEILRLWVEIAAQDSKLYTMVANKPKRNQPSMASCKCVLNPGTQPGVKREETNSGGGEGDKEMDVDVKMEAKVEVEVNAESPKICNCTDKVHFLKIFKALCGLENILNLLPLLFDKMTNEPVYYRNNSTNQLHMTGLYAEYLKTQMGNSSLAALKNAGFSTKVQTWKKQKTGDLEEWQNAKKIAGQQSGRKKCIAKIRCIGLEKGSKQTLDVKDKNCLVADDHELEADSTKLMSASLVRRGLGNKTRVTANAKKKTSYIKTNTNRPALKNNKCMPVWAISQTWILVNQAWQFEICPQIHHAKAEMAQVEIVKRLWAKYPLLAKRFVIEQPCCAGHGPLPEVPALVDQPANIPAAAPVTVPVPNPVPNPNPAHNP